MSGTTSRARPRVPSVVSVIGIVLVAVGVAVAIIIRIATMASVAAGPMPELHESDYSGYAVAPALPLANPYAANDVLTSLAFGVAAVGLIVLVLGVALHSTRRHSR